MSVSQQVPSNGVQFSVQETLEVGLSALMRRTKLAPQDVQRVLYRKTEIYDWLNTASTFNEHVASDLGWGWQLFTDEAKLRIGLLTLTPNNPVPPHDHPGSSGLLIVIDGQMHIRTYEHAEKGKRSVELKVSSDEIVGVGEYACYDPRRGNIHHIQAVDATCQVLSLVFNPYQEEQRNWFLPRQEEFTNLNNFSAVRVQRKK